MLLLKSFFGNAISARTLFSTIVRNRFGTRRLGGHNAVENNIRISESWKILQNSQKLFFYTPFNLIATAHHPPHHDGGLERTPVDSSFLGVRHCPGHQGVELRQHGARGRRRQAGVATREMVTHALAFAESRIPDD